MGVLLLPECLGTTPVRVTRKRNGFFFSPSLLTRDFRKEHATMTIYNRWSWVGWRWVLYNTNGLSFSSVFVQKCFAFFFDVQKECWIRNSRGDRIGTPISDFARFFSWYLSCNIGVCSCWVCRSSSQVGSCVCPKVERPGRNPRFWTRPCFGRASVCTTHGHSGFLKVPSKIARGGCESRRCGFFRSSRPGCWLTPRPRLKNSSTSTAILTLFCYTFFFFFGTSRWKLKFVNGTV